MTRVKFSLRTSLILVAIAACFAAFVRSCFADALSAFDLVPLVVAIVLVTVSFLVRAVNRGPTNALRLTGIGAAAAFSTTSVFGVAAIIVWSAYVYADDSKGFLISPWIIVSLYVSIFGSIAATVGAIIGGIFHLCANLTGRKTDGSLRSSTENHDMHAEDSAASSRSGFLPGRRR